MTISETIAQKLNVKNWQVEAAIRLIDEGNTIPFIARYRKEATGTLDDAQLRELGESLAYLRSLNERKEKVKESIREQGKLTKELETAIDAAQTLVAVEDLYLPYRPKRRTRAGIARERGLEGLAAYLMAQKSDSDPLAEASKYVDPGKEVPDAQAALQGAMDIIAEQISDDADLRAYVREKTWNRGTIVTSAKPVKKASSKDSTAQNKAGSKDNTAQDKAGSKDDSATLQGSSAKSTGTGSKNGDTGTGKNKEAGKAGDRQDVYEMYYEYEELLRRIPGHRVLAVNRGEKEG